MTFNFRPRSLQGLRNHILCCRWWKEVGPKPVEWYILLSTAINQVLIPVHGADPTDCVVLGRGFAAARLLGLRLRIPPGVSLRVVYCHVQVSASGWSLAQRNPTECGACNRVWSWSLDSEEALALALYALSRHENKPAKENNATVSRSYLISIKDVTFVFNPTHQHV